MTENFQTVTIGKNPLQIADASTGPVLLSNLDFTNTIYLSNQAAVDTQTASSAATIPPLGSVEINPDRTIWAACSDNLTAQLQFIPQGSGYTSSPVLIAEQILNSGIILVDNPQTLLSTTIGMGTLQAVINPGIQPFDVSTYQSWALSITQSSGGGTTPYYKLNMYWSTDLAGANVVWRDTWVLPFDLINYASFHGEGPNHGRYLWVTLQSYDNINDTIVINVMGSHRVVNRATIRSFVGPGPFPTPQNSEFGTDDYLVYAHDAALAAGTTSVEMACQYYNGPVTLRIRATGAAITAGAVLVHLMAEPVADFAGNDTYIIGSPKVANGANSSDDTFEIYFPKRPMHLTVQNTFTSSIVYRVSIIANGEKP